MTETSNYNTESIATPEGSITLRVYGGFAGDTEKTQLIGLVRDSITSLPSWRKLVLVQGS